MRDELCLREMVRARVRACARWNAVFAPFPYRAWPLRVALGNPASHGKRACGCVWPEVLVGYLRTAVRRELGLDSEQATQLVMTE